MDRKERSHDYYMRNREQILAKVRECQKRRVEREKKKLLIKN